MTPQATNKMADSITTPVTTPGDVQEMQYTGYRRFSMQGTEIQYTGYKRCSTQGIRDAVHRV